MPAGFTPYLTTERLVLRPIELQDRATVFAYRSDKRTNRYQGFVPERIEQVEDFIHRQPDSWNVPDRWFQLVIIENSTESLIGDIGVHFLEDERQCEIGITLKAESHRNGYAKEALSALFDHLFSDLKKHRITASVDPRNISCISMLEGLGFRNEAHFREAVFFKGEWVDDFVYGLLDHEWKK